MDQTSDPFLSRKKRRYSKQDWDNVRREACQIYLRGDRTRSDARLTTTMVEIERKYGLRACKRTWKTKLKQWGCTINVPKPAMKWVVAKQMQRIEDGKATDFFYKGRQIMPQSIQSFVGRNKGVVSLDATTPSDITYHTPEPNIEMALNTAAPNIETDLSLEETTSHARTSLDHLWLDCSPCRPGPEPTSTLDLSQVPHLSVIDEWMFDTNQPWSHINLSHQVYDHGDAVTDHDDIFEEVRELSFPFEELSVSADLRCIGTHPFLGSCHATEIEDEERDSEDAALKSLFALTGKFERYERQHPEETEQILQLRFELAKGLAGIGEYYQAEKHCRKVLQEAPQPDVQTLLGMILAKTDRVETATTWMFAALTGFIIFFNVRSLQDNVYLFDPMLDLFTELALRSEQDWAPLKALMRQMGDTLNKWASGEALSDTFPRLFIHGFYFAHACADLNLFKEAKYLYDYLLEESVLHFSTIQHALEKAIAHQRYGLLLRKERSWTASANQLLLACKSAMRSGSYDRRLVLLLAKNYDHLHPHLATQPDQGHTLAKEIGLLLKRMRYQSFTSNQFHVLSMERYFESKLPMDFAIYEPSAISRELAQFTLSEGSTLPSVASWGHKYLTSTAVLSIRSHKSVNATMNESKITSISDRSSKSGIYYANSENLGEDDWTSQFPDLPMPSH